MTENLLAMVESATLEAGNIEATTRRIHDEILAESQYLRTPNSGRSILRICDSCLLDTITSFSMVWSAKHSAGVHCDFDYPIA
jgi:hypothetical protein